MMNHSVSRVPLFEHPRKSALCLVWTTGKASYPLNRAASVDTTFQQAVTAFFRKNTRTSSHEIEFALEQGQSQPSCCWEMSETVPRRSRRCLHRDSTKIEPQGVDRGWRLEIWRATEYYKISWRPLKGSARQTGQMEDVSVALGLRTAPFTIIHMYLCCIFTRALICVLFILFMKNLAQTIKHTLSEYLGDAADTTTPERTA